MDPGNRTTDALNTLVVGLADEIAEQIGKLIQQYIQRFENMLSLVPMESTDKMTTGTMEMVMAVETNALIRTAEDTMRLTRQLQELWLFGNLDTLGRSETEDKTDEDAKAVARGIEELVKREEVGERQEALR